MAGSIRVKWEGAKLKGDARRAAAEGLQDALDTLLDESSRIVPHEEGILQGSGSTDIDPSALEGSVFYDTPYAVKQHEDMTLQHPNGRQAKYLEQPLKSREPELLDYIADKVRGALS